MRITGLVAISPVHLPAAELAAIEAIVTSERSAGSHAAIDFHGIALEAHRRGAFVSTAPVVDEPRPAAVSEALWQLLLNAEQLGCDWLLIDHDELPCRGVPRFD